MAHYDDRTTEHRTSGNGLTKVLISTAIAGFAGFVIQVGVGVLLGPDERYLSFSVFWAALYLTIGALSGIQQEISRSSAQGMMSVAGSGARVSHFVVITGSIVVAILAVSSFFWGPLVFGGDVLSSVVFLALGALGYVVLASQSGLLYGTRQWNTLAVSIVADPVIRCVLLACAVGLMLGPQATQLAIVLPLYLTVAVIGVVWWRSRAAVRLDVGVRALLWNVSRAVLGSAATAILVSGFPLFLKVGLQGASAELVATIIFVINFTRAPIVIPLLALQSYMVVSFARDRTNLRKRLLTICLIAVGGAALIAVVAYFLSPWVFGALLGGTYSPKPAFVGLVIAASGLTAALCATGSAALSRSQHGVFSVGWLVAAATTVLLLFVPLPAETRVVLALSVGPVAGLLVHTAGMSQAFAGSRSRVRDKNPV
jgi:O-antigen/teichoic acid export membrane protein